VNKPSTQEQRVFFVIGMSSAELVESSVAVQFYSEGFPDIKNALYNADSIYTLWGGAT